MVADLLLLHISSTRKFSASSTVRLTHQDSLNGLEESPELLLICYVCVALIVYSATSFENRDDLSSSSLAGVSRSTATPAKIGMVSVRPTHQNYGN